MFKRLAISLHRVSDLLAFSFASFSRCRASSISSSLLGLSSELKELDLSVTNKVDELSSRVHAVQVVGFVAVVVVAISLGTYFWAAINFYRAQTDTATQAATRAEQQVKVSDVQRVALEQKVKDLEQRLDKAKVPK